jgi:hypothetical protein
LRRGRILLRRRGTGLGRYRGSLCVGCIGLSLFLLAGCVVSIGLSLLLLTGCLVGLRLRICLRIRGSLAFARPAVVFDPFDCYLSRVFGSLDGLA